MTDFEVRIVTIAPMRVASGHGYGESPELIAWEKILAFARRRGLLEDLATVRFMGFNNPNPSSGSPNYGYDQWMTAKSEVQGDDEVEVFDFAGGLYAVARCEGLGHIGEVWKQLVLWFEESCYRRGQHQWMEELLTPELFVTPDGEMQGPKTAWDDVVFDLYLPIAE